jgi:hypothetical protein
MVGKKAREMRTGVLGAVAIMRQAFQKEEAYGPQGDSLS